MKYSEEELEQIIDQMKGIIDNFSSAQDEFDRNEFSKAYGDRLGAYSDKLKALNGDDFDIVSAAYDEHKNEYSDLSNDDYIDALEENIKKTIQRIWPEKPEEEINAVAEQVADEAIQQDEPPTETTETTVVTDNPEAAEAAVDAAEDQTTSDARTKRVNKMKDSWTGSPHTSGGRNGTTSDEKCKEEPEKAAEATPTKADDIVVKAAEVLGSPTQEVDEFEEFKKDLERYPKAK